VTSELQDRADIVDVCVRYARALDRRDWALLRTCFVPDVAVEYEGMDPIKGYDALERVCRAALEPLDVSQHLLGNFTVELDGDVAECECYLHAQHVRAGTAGGEQYVVAGTYRDTLRRDADGWLITHRTLDVVWTAGNSAVLGA
jgi:ketosteroid isomerase-like protein